MEGDYWSKVLSQRLSRRRAIASVGGGAAAAAFLAACGGDGEKATKAPEPEGPLDAATQGKPGGHLVWQGYGPLGNNLDLIAIPEYGIRQLSGLTHESLLQFKAGVAGTDPTDKTLIPELAEALPEITPDKLKYTFKLRNSTFHDGSPVTAQDVVYSYDTYANGDKSAWKAFFLGWFGKIEAPDARTVVVTTNFPFADAVHYFCSGQGINGFGDILKQSFQESPEANRRLMGSGPFILESHESEITSKLKRNPNYHLKPFPFFDTMERTGYADPEKKLADFIAKKVHFNYQVGEEAAERIKAARPDATHWRIDAGGGRLTMRTDKAPWNDARVRRAMSMSIDRQAIIQATNRGVGEPDQFLSWTGKFWGFRKPKELGANAKWWDYNIAEAKALLNAAGVQLPIKAKVHHWNAAVIGPAWVQQMTLMKTGWKNAGIADIESIEGTHVQINAGAFLGRYGDGDDTLFWFPNVVAGQAQIGLNLRLLLGWAPGAPPGPPSLNSGYVDDKNLTALLDKQLGQFDKQERISTFRQIEDLLAEQQYHVIAVTGSNNWFKDPTLKNAVPHQEGYQGAWHQIKYWWFDKA